MQFRKLGNSDLMIPAVGMGTWALGGGFWGDQDHDDSIRALHAGMETGKVLIDTAPAYGRGIAETVVGEAVKGRRSDVIIATKCGLVPKTNGERGSRRLLTRESIFEECEASLRRLDTDYIDLYQCHWPDDEGTPLEETAQALMDLKKQGKIRAIGLSNYSVAEMEEFKKYAQLDSLQPQFSLLERGIEAETLPWCIANNIGILSYGSLGAGLLSGKYTMENRPTDSRPHFYRYFQDPVYEKALALVEVLKKIAAEREIPTSHVAIGWAIAQPGVTCSLVGSRTPEQAVENLKAGDVVLNEEELAKIQTAWEVYNAE